MNFKTTIILAVLLLFLGGYLVYDQMNGPAAPAGKQKNSDVDREPVKLFSQPTDVATSLEIEKAGEGKVSLLKDPSGIGWRLTAPVTASADTMAVTSVLSRLTAADSRGTPAGELQSSFKPDLTVSFARPGEPVTTLAIASPNALGESVAQLSGGSAGRTTWHLVSSELLDSLRKKVEDLRDTRLVTLPQSDIRMITLESPAGSGGAGGGGWVRLLRDPGSGAEASAGWTIESGTGAAPPMTGNEKPGALRADDAAVSDLLYSLTSLKASAYPRGVPVPSTQSSASSTPGLLTVTYSVSGATTQPVGFTPRTYTLRFLGWEDVRKDRALVLSDAMPDAVAAVTQYSYSQLKKTALDLRDKRVLDIRPSDVKQIEIINTTEAATRPDIKPIILTAEADPSTASTSAPAEPRWQVNGEKADAGKVALLLESLRPLRATRFLSGPAATQPTTPYLLRLTTPTGTTELHVGDSAARFGDLTFELSSDLAAQLKGPFTVPLPPIPMALPPEDTSHPTTQPATQP
jgi:hypothetical protein